MLETRSEIASARSTLFANGSWVSARCPRGRGWSRTAESEDCTALEAPPAAADASHHRHPSPLAAQRPAGPRGCDDCCWNWRRRCVVTAAVRGAAGGDAAGTGCLGICSLTRVIVRVNAARARSLHVNAPSSGGRLGRNPTSGGRLGRNPKSGGRLGPKRQWSDGLSAADAGSRPRNLKHRRGSASDQCRSGLSSMPLESRAMASTAPETELRRKRMLFLPLSSPALTTAPSSPGTVTRVPAVM